ncbi:MAG: Na+/H+ antiporter subunit E [Gammaproteobacteria bacterium]|nr:Na+/H+ antiporter subunit E [Gammaproteobacteria bacterium]MCY4278769.1 Na+/H+ antiporter subunit E [Gammaproteobacteria bacterium]
MLTLLLILVLAWLFWSGLFTPLLLIVGALSCALTVYLVRRMGYFDTQLFTPRYFVRLAGYWGWLLWEVVRSSVQVARVVLSPSLPVSPQVLKIDAEDLEPVDQVVFGNSITLTPGTLALDLHDGKLLVHTLTREGADALCQGEMKRRVAALRSV